MNTFSFCCLLLFIFTPAYTMEQVSSNWAIEKSGNYGVRIAGTEVFPGNFPNLLNTILVDPYAILSVKKNSKKRKFRQDPSLDAFLQLIDPINLLDECDVLGCGCSRQSNRNMCRRNAAIRDLTIHAVQNINKNPIVVFYASGKLFFELEVLTHLKHHGVFPRAIVLIDPLYLKVMNLLQDDSSHSFSDLITMSDSIIKKKKTSFRTKIIIERLHQFARAISALRDQAEPTSIYLYGSAHEYTSDLQIESLNVNTFRPDLVIAMDYIGLGNSLEASNLDLIGLIWALENVNGIMATFSSYHSSIYKKVADVDPEYNKIFDETINTLFKDNRKNDSREILHKNLPMELIQKSGSVMYLSEWK